MCTRDANPPRLERQSRQRGLVSTGLLAILKALNRGFDNEWSQNMRVSRPCAPKPSPFESKINNKAVREAAQYARPCTPQPSSSPYTLCLRHPAHHEYS